MSAIYKIRDWIVNAYDTKYGRDRNYINYLTFLKDNIDLIKKELRDSPNVIFSDIMKKHAMKFENNIEKNIPIIRENWQTLSGNPAAIYLLEENIDKINWTTLSFNTAAIHLLKDNLDKVDWYNLSQHG
jgi:hypothetical protein